MIHSTEKVISHKVGLINLAEELQNVSQACKVMGFSRDTFYRYKDASLHPCIQKGQQYEL